MYPYTYIHTHTHTMCRNFAQRMSLCVLLSMYPYTYMHIHTYTHTHIHNVQELRTKNELVCAAVQQLTDKAERVEEHMVAMQVCCVCV